MTYQELLFLHVTSLNLNHQQFFYFDCEQKLKTTNEEWPKLEPFTTEDNLTYKAIELLYIMQSLAIKENMIHISRESIYKKSRRIAKSAADLNKILYYLHVKGYLNFQFSGVYGRKQFITLNPQIFIQ